MKKRENPLDVYLRVGFEDPSHFSFAFKKDIWGFAKAIGESDQVTALLFLYFQRNRFAFAKHCFLRTV
jgi:hypothetical protein